MNPYVERENLENRPKLMEAEKFRLAVYKKHDYKCVACGQPLDEQENIELHHILPAASGGKYTLSNIVSLHETCHKEKPTQEANQRR